MAGPGCVYGHDTRADFAATCEALRISPAALSSTTALQFTVNAAVNEMRPSTRLGSQEKS